MKITEITASFGRTYQTAPYEPVNIHASLKAEINEKEDESIAFDLLFKKAQKQVEMQLEQFIHVPSAPQYGFSESARKFAADIIPTGNNDRYSNRIKK